MAIQTVTLVGANGKLGPAILHALLSAPTITRVTVLSRSSSTSTYPPAVHVVRVADDMPPDELTRALTGQDALVVAFGGSNADLQLRLADAAARARVRRFIPADFGSCDSSSPRTLELVALYRAKARVRAHLVELASAAGAPEEQEEEEGEEEAEEAVAQAAQASAFSWTSLICGHFFDYGLKCGLLQFDLAARRARFFDGGDVRWSATTLETIAAAVVSVLAPEHELQTRNRLLYIQSFCVSQKDVLASWERVTAQGADTWRVEQVDSRQFVAALRGKADGGDPEALEELVSVLGIVDANWEDKKDFANPLLGLETEDLDQVVRRVVGS